VVLRSVNGPGLIQSGQGLLGTAGQKERSGVYEKAACQVVVDPLLPAQSDYRFGVLQSLGDLARSDAVLGQVGSCDGLVLDCSEFTGRPDRPSEEDWSLPPALAPGQGAAEVSQGEDREVAVARLLGHLELLSEKGPSPLVVSHVRAGEGQIPQGKRLER